MIGAFYVISIFSLLATGAIGYYVWYSRNRNIRDVQTIIDQLNTDYATVFEELAKSQKDAITQVITKQTAVNKIYKSHIERIWGNLHAHNAILPYTPPADETVEMSAAEENISLNTGLS